MDPQPQALIHHQEFAVETLYPDPLRVCSLMVEARRLAADPKTQAPHTKSQAPNCRKERHGAH
jgi:hypothetical protein